MFRRLAGIVGCLSIAVGTLAVVVSQGASSASAAGLGTLLRTLTPSPSGNGRAMAFDPGSHHLFYTNDDDHAKLPVDGH